MSGPPVPPADPTRPMPVPGWAPPGPPAGYPPAQQPGYPQSAPGQPAGAWPAPPQPWALPHEPAPKKSHTGLIIAIVIGAVLLCGGLATAGFILAGRFINTIEDPGQPTAQTYELGQAATVEQDGARLTVTVTRAEWFDAPCTSLGRLINGRAVVLDVTFEAIAGTARAITPSDFEFITEDGQLYPPGFNASGCVRTLLGLASELAAGQTLSGQIDFDVPTGGELRYLVPAVDGSTVSWRIEAT